MTINSLNIIETWYQKIRMQILVSLYAFKLVKNIISNFIYAFSRQFMKFSMSWRYVLQNVSFSFLN